MSHHTRLNAFEYFMKEIRDEEAKLGICHRNNDEYLHRLAIQRWQGLSADGKEYYRKMSEKYQTPEETEIPKPTNSPVVIMSNTIQQRKPQANSIQKEHRHSYENSGQAKNNLKQNRHSGPMASSSSYENSIVNSLSNSSDTKLLSERVGSNYVSHRYIIVSTHVFVRNNKICIPAEVGIAKYSFFHGIMGTFHSFFPPSDLGHDHEAEVLRSQKSHKIPLEDFDFPNLRLAIHNVHKFIYSVKADTTKTTYIFAENDEIEQARDVFDYIMKQSDILNLKLVWNLKCISLSTLFVYLKNQSPSKAIKWNPADVLDVFKNDKFENAELCYFHVKQKCSNCAISKCFIFCYILSDYFCSTFGISPIEGTHTPMAKTLNTFI